MADDRTIFEADDGPSVGRVALACCCVVAVVLAASLVAPLSAAVGGAPAKSLVLFGSGSTSELGGLGALSPGSRATVGGTTDGANPYRSLDTEVHFTVDSPEPAHWRTGSYATYSESGWTRRDDVRPYRGDVSPDARGESLTYRVTMMRSATALPTVWRPNTVSVDGGDDLSVTAGRAVVAPAGVDAGTTYTAESTRQSRDPAVLRTAGTDYPDAVAARYTALPDTVSPRVARLTDEVTTNASTPYAKAVAVERYLEAHKVYSLSAAHEGGDPVSAFLFEMDEGYCEYFASSMAVMLRTQDVPARYVVGYSTGERTDADTYTVRNMNAHAWVEVYFPDVGWVRFDPTPGRQRLDAERRAYEERESGTYETPESTETPAETPTATPDPDAAPSSGASGPSTSAPAETPSDAGRDDSADDSNARTSEETVISLDSTPVPGAEVTVAVRTRTGDPVPGRTVLFNGDPVGTTNAAGRVTATVPYASELTVSLAGGDDARATVDADAVGFVPRGGPALFSLADPRIAVSRPNDSVSYPLETNASLSFVGSRVTGAEVLVVASVADVPVRGAEVTVDGAPVSWTDEDGRAAVTLPARPGNVSVGVSRGAISGEETLELSALSVDVVDPSLLPLPYATATVRTTLGSEGAGGVPVSVNGERVAATGPNGTATVTLPLASSAGITAERYGQTAETTVSGMLLNAFAVLGTGLVGLGAVAVGAYRRGASPLTLLFGLLSRAAGLFETLLSLLVSGVGAADALLDGLRALGDRLRDVGRRVRDRTLALSDLPALAVAWATVRLAALRTRSEAFGASVARRAGLAADSPDSETRTVRDCWDEFRGHVSVPDQASRTPGELAAHAVAVDGLPAEAVYALRDGFRDVEYGGRSPTDRSAAMERATAEIRRAVESAADDDTAVSGGDAE